MNYKNLSRFFVLVTIAAIVAVWSFMFIGCGDSDNGTGTESSISSAWTIEELSLEGNHFQSACFIDEENGWLAGKGGNIIHTTNGGDSWTQLPSITMDNLWDITFFDADTGWAVGERGHLLRTHDGGMSWQYDLFQVTDESIYSVVFLSAEKLFAAGSNATLLFSLDGGRNLDSSPVEGDADIFDISIYDTTGVAVGDSGRILIGTDFSNVIERLFVDTIVDTTWIPDTTTTQESDSILSEIDITMDTLLQTFDTVWVEWDTTNSGVSLPLNSVSMVNSTTGWAVGDSGTILNTTDAGQSWTAQAVGGLNDNLLKVRFDDISNGWVVGANGTILSTSDGGNTWVEQTSDVNFDLYDIAHPTSSDEFWAVGSLALLKSTDGCTTWEKHSSETIPTPSLMDITFVNDSLGFAVGYAAILRTTDGGDSWEYRRRDPEYSVDKWYTNVKFLNDDTGYCFGQYRITPGNGLILKTVDGGDTWEKQVFMDELPEAVSIEDMFFLDNNNCWIVAGKKILKSINGGLEWESLEVDAPSQLNAIVFTNEESGWAVGMGGTIMTTDSTTTAWENITSDSITTKDLYDVAFVNDTTGWVVGEDGIILNTNDGGEIWTEQESGTHNGLNTIAFADELTGWVIGYGGTILYTTDGGETWTSQPSPTLANLNGIAGVDSTYSHVWIVGENGLILSTTTGGI
ncbi:MAG: YCF48-related protein [candidate division Zixibacteria bacterium]|nr:YCF48-related protein [candidate division Zixibacteria bacterium]